MNTPARSAPARPHARERTRPPAPRGSAVLDHARFKVTNKP